jgi:putative flippase GtrA
MSPVSPKITNAIWRMVPGPLRAKLRSQGGRRLVRFAPAAVLALLATQLTYFILQLLHVTAGVAGAAGWFAGAAVSYLVSRWAWERKGRPHLLKETLPFVAVSLCVGVILTSASKFAHYEARVLGLHGFDEVLFAQGLYLAANCGTFIIRFLIFHYLLFADRGPRFPGAPESVPPAPPSGLAAGPAPYAMASSGNGSAPVSGPASANGSGVSEDTGPIGPSAAEPRPRR